MIGKSNKVLNTERWVDAYIEMNGHPPTYKEVGEHFEIGKCATYSRCAKFRNKMNQHSKKNIDEILKRVDEILNTNDFRKSNVDKVFEIKEYIKSIFYAA